MAVHTLANGLRLVHTYVPSTAMVAVNVLYDVGARDESPELTGIAHLFEHLMFGGSVNVPSFDGELEEAGGMSNAWTSDDFTNFYDILPAQNIETALRLESDRMLSLSFSQRSLDIQKGVVIEEFKQQCLNQQYGDIGHHLRGMLYAPGHPYRIPVIGKDPSHIENATLEDIRRFFFAHYAPDNAILSIAGNVDYDTTLRLVEKWFGGIPSRNVAVRDSVASGTMPGQGQTLTVHGRVPQTMIVAAWRMAAYNEPDYIPCDIITDLLASGNSSRMRRNLILGTDLFVEADASISGLEGHGYLMLTAKPSAEDSKTVAAATAALISEARKLCDPAAITGHELQRAANRYEAMYAMRQMGYAEQALTAAIAEYHGEDPAQATVRYRNAAKAEAIAAAARCTLSSEPAVLLYRPH